MKWFLLLSKRLYKKATFVAILVIIPLCVFAFSIIAKQDSGFVHIVLAHQGDPLSEEIARELEGEDSIIDFTLLESKEEAIELVKSGQADEAWIFPKNLGDSVDKFLGNKEDSIVSVVTGEQSVALRLSREKLSAALYKYCAKAYYLDYIRANVPELDGISEEKLVAYYDETAVDEELFVYADPVEKAGVKTNYLTSPIRGLLGIMTLVSAMAAAMYFMEDERSGTFAFVKHRHKNRVFTGCVLTAVLNVSVIILLSLCLGNLSGNIFREIAIILLYAMLCTAFAVLLGQIFVSLRGYASMIPLLTVACIGVCPVFFDFKGIWQILLPPTYYVNALYNGKYFLYMLVYIAVCLTLTFIIERLKNIKAR